MYGRAERCRRGDDAVPWQSSHNTHPAAGDDRGLHHDKLVGIVCLSMLSAGLVSTMGTRNTLSSTQIVPWQHPSNRVVAADGAPYTAAAAAAACGQDVLDNARVDILCGLAAHADGTSRSIGAPASGRLPRGLHCPGAQRSCCKLDPVGGQRLRLQVGGQPHALMCGTVQVPGHV
jgi:hypothetical protein